MNERVHQEDNLEMDEQIFPTKWKLRDHKNIFFKKKKYIDR